MSQTKIREGMRMMGLSDSALLGSWYAMYAIIFFVVSVIIGEEPVGRGGTRLAPPYSRPSSPPTSLQPS